VPPDIINDRLCDIIDRVLIRENLYANDPTPPALRAARADVFAARAEEARAIGTVPRQWPTVFKANASHDTLTQYTTPNSIGTR
jgi:hypothetical protein